MTIWRGALIAPSAFSEAEAKSGGNTLCISEHFGDGFRKRCKRGACLSQIVSGATKLALTLLVLGVFANNHNFALALDDLALLAHGLDARSDFH